MRLSLALKGAIQIILQRYNSDDTPELKTEYFLDDNLESLQNIEKEVENRAATTALSDSEKSIIISTAFLEDDGITSDATLVGDSIGLLKELEAEITAYEDLTAQGKSQLADSPDEEDDEVVDIKEEDSESDDEIEEDDNEIEPPEVDETENTGLRGQTAEVQHVDDAGFGNHEGSTVAYSAQYGEPAHSVESDETPTDEVGNNPDEVEQEEISENESAPVDETDESDRDTSTDVDTETESDKVEQEETESDEDDEEIEDLESDDPAESKEDWENEKPF